MADEINRERPVNAAETPPPARSPGGLRWLLTKAGWVVESVLWRIGDSFRWIADGFRTRGALGNSLAVLMIALVLGAGGATAVHLTSGDGSEPAPPVTAQVPVQPQDQPATAISPQAEEPEPEGELHGVVPDFEPQGDGSGGSSGVGSAEDSGGRPEREPVDEVDPAPVPDSPPLAVAHRFATAFVSYEVGEDTPKVHRALERSATEQLARALSKRPPRLPSEGEVPKAAVVNVVKGPGADKKSMDVSVALKRLGATSELRLGLAKTGKRWLVERIVG